MTADCSRRFTSAPIFLTGLLWVAASIPLVRASEFPEPLQQALTRLDIADGYGVAFDYSIKELKVDRAGELAACGEMSFRFDPRSSQGARYTQLRVASGGACQDGVDAIFADFKRTDRFDIRLSGFGPLKVGGPAQLMREQGNTLVYRVKTIANDKWRGSYGGEPPEATSDKSEQELSIGSSMTREITIDRLAKIVLRDDGFGGSADLGVARIENYDSREERTQIAPGFSFPTTTTNSYTLVGRNGMLPTKIQIVLTVSNAALVPLAGGGNPVAQNQPSQQTQSEPRPLEDYRVPEGLRQLQAEYASLRTQVSLKFDFDQETRLLNKLIQLIIAWLQFGFDDAIKSSSIEPRLNNLRAADEKIMSLLGDYLENPPPLTPLLSPEAVDSVRNMRLQVALVMAVFFPDEGRQRTAITDAKTVMLRGHLLSAIGFDRDPVTARSMSQKDADNIARLREGLSTQAASSMSYFSGVAPDDVAQTIQTLSDARTGLITDRLTNSQPTRLLPSDQLVSRILAQRLLAIKSTTAPDHALFFGYRRAYDAALRALEERERPDTSPGHLASAIGRLELDGVVASTIVGSGPAGSTLAFVQRSGLGPKSAGSVGGGFSSDSQVRKLLFGQDLSPSESAQRLYPSLKPPTGAPPGGWVSIISNSRGYTGGVAVRTAIESLATGIWPILGQPMSEALSKLGIKRDSRIAWMPSGSVAFMPINLARDPVSGVRIIDQYEIVAVPSIELAVRNAGRTRRPMSESTIVGFFNSELNQAGLERDLVSKGTSPNRFIDLPAGITPKDALQRLRGGDVWHFATHGNFNWSDARLSGISLGENQRLTIRDLMSYASEFHPRLVVLSACETGIIGHDDNPDAFIGLPMAFMAAGAQGVVASLWPVDDRSTALLMGRFYQLMRSENARPSSALRKAQLWLRDSSRADLLAFLNSSGQGNPAVGASRDYLASTSRNHPFSDPYYWGGFMFYGT